jgi:hypothetical protein
MNVVHESRAPLSWLLFVGAERSARNFARNDNPSVEELQMQLARRPR